MSITLIIVLLKAKAFSIPSKKFWYLSHDLPAIKQHFVSFSETIFRTFSLLFSWKIKGKILKTWISGIYTSQVYHKASTCYPINICWFKEHLWKSLTISHSPNLYLLCRKKATILINEIATAAPISTPVHCIWNDNKDSNKLCLQDKQYRLLSH